MLGNLFGILHIWDKEPENRLIDTTKPVLENGVDAFHEKMWDESDIAPTDVLGLPPEDRTKSWEGPHKTWMHNMSFAMKYQGETIVVQ
eukprot:CAMPEP_0197834112 /NCGR_PEP_ID=MMETSP1437-20131217/21247_1 /TAXON_ID=49252 ORGANISM="Eucampia antarctica, Strain CCMP1452" /NCGR_SAMPLE_ID=MMETSP1437 /ASSEMBLY_ACC=CAM_ASM_001096 /LENGTH=87 /DNA_ID=CAMNT_0043438567 /DNA_START=1 /DNA_END=264 /DNA_ORIENTATION=+